MQEYVLITHPDLLKENSVKNKILISEWSEGDGKKQSFIKFSPNEYPLEKKNEEQDGDTEYLNQLYEKILKSTSEKLNELHSANYDIRYWRMTVGSYLRYIIHITFDRWNIVQNVKKKFKINETFLKKYIDDSAKVNDTKELDNISQSSFDFNHLIFCKILKKYSDIKVTEIGLPINFGSLSQYKEKKTSYKINPKKIKKDFFSIKKINYLLIKVFQKISNKITLYFFKSSHGYLKKLKIPFLFLDRSVPWNRQFFYYLKNKQFPWNFSAIWNQTESIKSNVDYNLELRKKILSNSEYSRPSIFEKCLLDIIWSLMPTSFLEDYKNLKDKTKDKIYSFKTDNIIMRSSDYQNDFQKILVAEKVAQGSSLIIHQWRAGPNILKNHYFEKHDRTISDKYITWGWKDEKDIKIYPLGHFNEVKNHKYKFNPEGVSLLVGYEPREFNLHCYNATYETHKSCNDIFEFHSNLNEEIKSNIVIRPKPSVFDSQIKKLLEEKIPNVKCDLENHFLSLLDKSRVCICTNPDSHTYLDTLTLNVPTIIFWTKKSFNLTESAKNDFLKLEEVGIFHRSPLSAALKLNSVWKNIPDWWFSEKVQEIRKNYCNNWYKYPVEYDFFLKKL